MLSLSQASGNELWGEWLRHLGRRSGLVHADHAGEDHQADDAAPQARWKIQVFYLF